MRRIHLALALILTLLTVSSHSSITSAAPTVAPAKAPLSAQTQRIVELVNLRRREAGLRPLNVHPTLVSCAQQYSEVQASQGRISHTGPDGKNAGQRLRQCGYRWKHYGENLAAGHITAEEVVAAWMASPGHRRVILHRKVTEIGIGTAHRASDPSLYYDYYAMAVGIRK